MHYEFIETAPIHIETQARQPVDTGGISQADIHMTEGSSGGIAYTQPSSSSMDTQPGPSSATGGEEDNLYFMKKRWEDFEANPLTYEMGHINNFLQMSPWENQIDVVDMALGNNLHLVHTTDLFAGAIHNIAMLATRALGDYKAAKALYAVNDYIKDYQRAIPKYVWDRMIQAYYPAEAAAQAKESAAYKISASARKQKQSTSEGASSYRSVAPPVGKIPVMQGPTKASGGWRIPPPVAPPYVAAHRARMGYKPRVARQQSPTPSLLGAPREFAYTGPTPPPTNIPVYYTNTTIHTTYSTTTTTITLPTITTTKHTAPKRTTTSAHHTTTRRTCTKCTNHFPNSNTRGDGV